MSNIKKIFDEKKITQKQLMEDLHVSQPYASALMNGKKSIGKNIATKLKELYDIDLFVVMKDYIQMYEVKTAVNAKKITEFDYPIQSDNRVTELGNGKYGFIVPLVPEYGYAGYISGWKDPEYMEELPKHMVVVDHPPKGEYLAIEVVGDSMENWNDPELARQSIREGEIVTGRNIPQHYWNSRFHIHKFKDFIIVHNEGILVKRIIEHDVEKGIITCRSLNPAYEDFDLHLSEVKQILNIVHPKR